MAILIAVVHVRPSVVVIVFSGALNAIMVALTLNVSELLGRCVPANWPLPISGRLLSSGRVLGHSEARCSNCNSKYRKCDSI
jgi:hypothetical protein